MENIINAELILFVKIKDKIIIPSDDCGLMKRFVFKIPEKEIVHVLIQNNSKLELLSHLAMDRYFFEFLMELGFSDTVNIAHIEFNHENNNYIFSYLDNEYTDQFDIDIGTYGEEFGKMSDFDFYDAIYGNDKTNYNYTI